MAMVPTNQSRSVVAIDFGTSTTLIAVRPANGIPEVIPIGDQPGVTMMPSIIDSEDLTKVGETVLEGRRHLSVKSELTRIEQFAVSPEERSLAEARVRAIINEAVRRARQQLPDLFNDSDVFVGCPALWSGENRKRLATIVHDLGLSVDYGNVLDEPVAAGISWIRSEWLEGGSKPVGSVLVFDPGGGTLDVAYLRVAENRDADLPDISIYYADSIAKSGDYVDSLLTHSLGESNAQLFNHKLDPALRNAARAIKEQLSFRTEARVNVGEPINAVIACDRPTLNMAMRPLIADMHRLIENVVKGTLLRRHGGITPFEIRTNKAFDYTSVLAAEVDYVVLAGGLSRTPLFADELGNTFRNAKIISLDNPQEAVVTGLCYGKELVHLNLPRPPISFFANVSYVDDKGAKISEEICVYEAFSPIFRFADAVAGNGNIYASWRCDIKHQATVEFYAVVPTIHDKTPLSSRLVAFESTVPELVPPPERLELNSWDSRSGAAPQSHAQRSSTFVRTRFTHDPRSATGEARFVMYPTAEILFQGASRQQAVRVDSWSPTPANFELGNGIAIARLWYAPADRRSTGLSYTEDWRFN